MPALTPKATPSDPCLEDLARIVYDGEFERIHSDLRDVLKDPVFDPRENLNKHEAGRLSYDRTFRMQRGLGSAVDLVADPMRMFAVTEWSSLLDTTTTALLNSHYNLCLGAILQHGEGRTDLDDYIEELGTMSSVGMLMVTELGYGNNVANLATEAVYDPVAEEFVLNTPHAGAQKFMPYTGIRDIPKIAIVMARLKVGGTDHGILPFIVPLSDHKGLLPGVHAAPCPENPGLSLDNGTTWFDHVRLPHRNLLSGKMGRLDLDGTFHSAIRSRRKRLTEALDRVNPGRVSLAASIVAAGRASTYISVTYSLNRQTAAPGHGREMPIMGYRTHQVAVLGALAKVYAMTFLVNHTKRRFAETRGADAGEVTSLVNIVKALTSWEMSEVIHTCRERIGAQGVFSVNRIADYVGMAQGVVTAEGDALPRIATTALELLWQTPRSPLPQPPVTTEGDMADCSLQLELMRYRETHLRETFRKNMRGLTTYQGEDPFTSLWNDNITTAVAMARSRGVRIAMEQFIAAAMNARDERVGDALSLLCSLYGLIEINREAGWHLAEGALSPAQFKQIPELIDETAAALVPFAALLVGGFNLSPELLRAPIADDDYLTAVDRYIWSRVSPDDQAKMDDIRRRKNNVPVIGPRSPQDAAPAASDDTANSDDTENVEDHVPGRV
ncbi:acyl-CoA dehydrogenase [Amycolatopsis decaplanina]|uniref:Acyl-CoA oxidase n=1 Tax=Amycolatopsis decaplanina DSM 44594 TaxID=1284240 RepID=M2X1P7_9PSEU|nr:acyl-CoA dehydrogenase [Amycolatopsis decaplanina]EME54946.1 acyl-CoA oxidase [Amycolatopsis decaplanina DSM 44594]